jgi:FtsP/CotA-like multicopper oxidase with cupredoxin domain
MGSAEIRPRIPQDAPDHPLQVHVLSSSRGVFVDVNGFTYAGQGFNNISYKNQINDPLLSQVESGLSLDDSLIAHIQFDGVGGGDIVVNNLDLGISHPFHLHGRSFYLVGRGTGNITAEQAWGMNFQSSNPPRRDTLQIAGASWAVLRE